MMVWFFLLYMFLSLIVLWRGDVFNFGYEEYDMKVKLEHFSLTAAAKGYILGAVAHSKTTERDATIRLLEAEIANLKSEDRTNGGA